LNEPQCGIAEIPTSSLNCSGAGETCLDHFSLLIKFNMKMIPNISPLFFPFLCCILLLSAIPGRLTTAQAQERADPILSIDFNDRDNDLPDHTQPGFHSFIIDGPAGIETFPVIHFFGDIKVTFSGSTFAGFDDRKRATPVNAGAFTEEKLLQDFIFSREPLGEGFDILIEPLPPNQTFHVTIWSFDTGSTGNRVSDWFANDKLVREAYAFNGAVLPARDEDYRFSFNALSDGQGKILIQGRGHPSSSSPLAVFINALQLTPVPDAAPEITKEPAGAAFALGDRAILSVDAFGSEPLTFEWRKDGTAIPGATESRLVLNELTPQSAGAYTVEVKNAFGAVLSAPASITVQPDPAPNVSQGMLSYWPFDTAAETTPDLVSRNDMALVNMGPGNLFPGKFNNALEFFGFEEYAHRLGGFPVYNNPVYTIAFWVKGQGIGQTDLRVFAEGSTTDNNPLFTMGTDNTGSTPSLNMFIRNNGGGTALPARQSTRAVFDNEWRHVVWVDNNGQAKLYVDGVLDETDFSYPRGTLTLNTTSVGGILRAASSHWFTGLMDEVALWNRALSWTEIQEIMNQGITPPAAAQPPAITQQPAGAERFAGESVTFSIAAIGTGPLQYQWNLNGTEISGATAATFTLENLQTASAGNYTVTVRNDAGTITSEPAELRVIPVEDLSTALVAYWPFETIIGNTTPDLVGGYHMTLHNMDAAQQVEGVFGNALSFDGIDQYLSRTHTNNTSALPIYQHHSYTVSLWVKGWGEGQVDRRVFSEGSTTDAGPLLNIGTDNTGATGAVDIFIRNNSGGGTPVPHLKSVVPGFDDAWRHIVWVDQNGTAALYIDGVRDETVFNYARGALNLNTTSIGGILRAAPSHFFAGLIDEVALWKRALTEEEIPHLMINGPGAQLPSLKINQITLANSQIQITITTPNPSQEHRLQISSTLNPPTWADLPNVSFTSPDASILTAQFAAPQEAPRFYRVIQVP
jgi:hypothetical protein